MSKLAKIGVLGASGYTGSECVRLLLRHPQVEIALLTADRNLTYQQNLTGRVVAIVVLGTNHWGTIRENQAPILDALTRCKPGSFIEVAFDRPPPRKGRGRRFGL